MSDPNLCGACAGVDAETPARIDNPPGQAAIAYRVGRHATFKQSLIARLSSTALPALGGLTARDDSDFSIALCDALATTLDVLAFYQERIANEHYLRTATERLSVVELARLIGYEPSPGVAASTYLAFTLQEVPGAPALGAGPVDVPVGTRVQSVPGPGEQPQTFETVEVVSARSDWNALPAQSAETWRPQFGDTSLWLAGVGNNIQVGDVILIVGQERLDDPGSERWDIRIVSEVIEDRVAQRTRLAWAGPLGSVAPHIEPTSAGASVHVFRQRAALFGHNAPDPQVMAPKDTAAPLYKLLNNRNGVLTWKDYRITGTEIDLDAAYPKVAAGSWIALVSNEATTHPSGLSGYVELYRASVVSCPSRSDFGLAGKVTRIEPDTSENLDRFRNRLRENLVLAQSEALAVAATPLDYPLFGDTLALDRLAADLGAGRALAISGKRARVQLRSGRPSVAMTLDDGGSVTIDEGDSLRMAAAPEEPAGGDWQALTPPDFGARLRASVDVQLRLKLIDRDGRQGTLVTASSAIELTPADDKDETVQEIAFVGTLPTAVSHDRDRTTFTLAAALKHCYDRATARVCANVARATHGESVTEILGSGNARVPNATFDLKQTPLTFVSAATPSGRQSTLEVRANDLLWKGVDTLYVRGAAERVYRTEIHDGGGTTVRFGDGIEGARLPSGDHNVRARYRKGLGLAGNVAADKLTTLLSRPLGVTGANNPEPATGGDDPEPLDRARDNAPLTMLTLDRAVSVRDYRDFARAFAGIAKAHALWIPSGPARGIFLTVAGENGAAIPADGATYRNLYDALRAYGDALMPISLVSYRSALFKLRLTVKVTADADLAVVLPTVETKLRGAFGFASRSFGQSISVDEVAAVVQAVTGVEAVNVVELHRSDAPSPVLVPRLFAAVPVASLTQAPLAAELLTLDDGSLVLDQMP